MGRAHVIVHNDLLGRLNGELREKVTVINFRPFCDDTVIALVSSDALPEGYHGQQDIIIDGSEIRFRKDLDV